MTADARPPLAPIPADPAARTGIRVDRPRLFPSRLGPPRLHVRSGNLPPGDAGRAWLVSRLQLRHAGIEHRITEEAARPRPDAETLGALKRERLAVRDRMATLESRPA